MIKLEGENVIEIKTKKGSVSKIRPQEEKAKSSSELEAFLEGLGLGKYLDTFTKNGLGSPNDVLKLRDEDFAAMRVSLGHKLKILKRAKELKSDAEVPLKGSQVETEALEDHKTISSSRSTLKEIDKSESQVEQARMALTKIKGDTRKSESSKVSCSCQGESTIILKQNERKESCWSCYKVFVKDKGYFDSLTNKVTTAPTV